MSGVINQRVSLGQANGPDVDLIVNGTELYATYRTVDGFPAVYDDDLGLFSYARLVGGRFESTGVSVASSPPEDVDRHAAESNHVRAEKISERESHLDRSAHSSAKEEEER